MPAKTILLTGAGFSCDFGGFLRKDMWSKIFNNQSINNYPRIKELASKIRDNDYESIYIDVHEGSFSSGEKRALDDAFMNAYRLLDEEIRKSFNRNVPRDVRMLIERFSKRWEGGEYFFTLNQDLLIERWFSEYIHVPFFSDANRITMIRDKYFSDEYDYFVPKHFQNQEPLNAAHGGRLHYIKLHGSLNWKSSDGNRRMVIGYNKHKQIADEPLLECYYDIFKKELLQGKPRLLVVGYSFSDEHVNKVIVESDLELHVIDRSEFQSFKDGLETKPHGEKIKEKICKGYYHPRKMIEIFPPEGTGSHAWQTIKDSLFRHNN